MKRNSLKVVLISCLMLSFGSASFSQDKTGTTAATFLGLGIGAKAVAMGGANVAIANDVSALYWNPSGITQIGKNGATFSNANWFVDSKLQNAAVSLNLAGGSLGISLLSLNYGEMEVTTISNPEGTGEVFTPTDLSIGLSYARALTDKFSIGGTTKFVRQTIWNEAANGMAIDLGVLYNTGFKNMQIGMSISNFGTDMKLDGKDLRVAHDIDQVNEGNNPRLPALLETNAWTMPLMFRVGLAMDAVSSASSKVTVAVDALHPSDNSTSANFGVEYAFLGVNNLEFALRGGYRQAFSAIDTDGGWTAGAGLSYEINRQVGFQLDVAMQEHKWLGNTMMWSFGTTF